jgi:hypothetical protein
MYINAKIISVEISRNLGKMKESSGGGEFKYDVIDIL